MCVGWGPGTTVTDPPPDAAHSHLSCASLAPAFVWPEPGDPLPAGGHLQASPSLRGLRNGSRYRFLARYALLPRLFRTPLPAGYVTLARAGARCLRQIHDQALYGLKLQVSQGGACARLLSTVGECEIRVDLGQPFDLGKPFDLGQAFDLGQPFGLGPTFDLGQTHIFN